MDIAALKTRVSDLIALSSEGNASPASVGELHMGTLTVMRALYGPASSSEALLAELVGAHRHNRPDLVAMRAVLRGTLTNLQREIDGGFIGALHARIAGEVLADLVGLAKTVLTETGDGAKNVGCVLAAAAFEDTLRRLAAINEIPHQERLADVLEALRQRSVLQGAQVGLAQGYLSFRNKALHAKWAEVDRPEAQSALAFVEALLADRMA